MQWLDPGTLAILDALGWALPSLRMLVVLTFRPGHRPPRSLAGLTERLDIRALESDDARRLLGDLLGQHPSVGTVGNMILDRAAGNPYFIEESVWALVDAGVLSGDRGRFRLVRPIERVPLPGTLQATLGARIDQLPAEHKKALQTAAVIGFEFDADLLGAVLGSDGPHWSPVLTALARGGFIDRSEGADVERYRFCHPLMQEEAYFSQLGESRTRAHALVAAALAESDPGQADARASLVGHHWENAGDPLQAARWIGRGARWVAARRMSEALRHWHKVRAIVSDLPGEEARSLQIEACTAILELGARVGLSEVDATVLFDEAERLIRYRGDDIAFARLLVAHGQVLVFAGEVARSLAPFQRAVELAERSGDSALRREVVAALVWGHFSIGNFREAVRLAEEIMIRSTDGGGRLDRARDVQLLVIHAMAIVDMGRIDEARRELEVASEAAQRVGAIEPLILAWSFAPSVAMIAGDDGDLALARARRAVHFSDGLESPVSSLLARWGLAVAHLVRQEWSEATAVLGGVLATARERGMGLQGEAGMLSHLADAALGLGQVDEAIGLAREAVAVGRARRTTFFECVALLGLAKVLLASGEEPDLAEIDASIGRAAGIVDAEGVVSLAPVVAVLRSMRDMAAGSESRAILWLREAQRMFEVIGAHGHASRLREAIPAEVIP